MPLLLPQLQRMLRPLSDTVTYVRRHFAPNPSKLLKLQHPQDSMLLSPRQKQRIFAHYRAPTLSRMYLRRHFAPNPSRPLQLQQTRDVIVTMAKNALHFTL